jgi:phosphoenolpyruvate carboxykinase (ATP)
MRLSPTVRLVYLHIPASDPHLHAVIGRDLEYFSQAGFDMEKITLKRNAPIALLYEDAIRNEGAIISSTGALINFSGKKTGRSPTDTRIVFEETSKDEIWWGSVNIKMDERMSSQSISLPSIQLPLPDTFEINRERAIDYLNTRDNVYVFDGFAGVGFCSSTVLIMSSKASGSGTRNIVSKFG